MYMRGHIAVLGCLTAKVSLNGVSVTVPLYFMKNRSALLGMDVFKALKFTINHDCTVTDFITSASVHSVANA